MKQCLNFAAAFRRNDENFVSIKIGAYLHIQKFVSFNKGPYEYDAAKPLLDFPQLFIKKEFMVN